MITYKDRHNKGATVTDVFLDRVKVGTIYPNGPYWHYLPKGTHRPGESMSSVAAVKRSLERAET